MSLESLPQIIAAIPERKGSALLRKLFDALRTSRLYGSAVYDTASLATMTGATGTITVTGAAMGDFASVSLGVDLQGMSVTAYVSAANTVSFRIFNGTAGTIDLASTTVRAMVDKRESNDGTYFFGTKIIG